jgi:hypothetical protein
MTDQLTLLFSKPIFRSKIKTEVDISNVEWEDNTLNQISKSRNILVEESFKELSTEINSKIFEYFYNIMRVSPEVEIYVTTSWLNKTKKGEEHHRHTHPNSILSGVVNLFGSSNAGGNLYFLDGEYKSFRYDFLDYNMFNSPTWQFPFETKIITIFPSSTEHAVDLYYGEEPRITLSFNTFIKGKIHSDNLNMSSNLII